MGKSDKSERCVYTTAADTVKQEFFMYVEPGEVEKWRKDKTIPIVEVVQAFQIFEVDNKSSQGIAMRPSKADLANAFGTEDEHLIVEKILMEGKIVHSKEGFSSVGSKGFMSKSF